MTHNENWDDLRLVLAVAEEGSVNAAAARLGVNHATILRRIATFEGRRGVKVFRKSPQGYRVDPAAVGIVDAIRAVDGAVDRLDRLVAGDSERLSGPIQLTSTDSLSLTLLPRHVAGFQAAHPALRVLMLSTNARLNLARLDAEVTIRPAQALPQDLVGTRAGTLRHSVYGATEYLADHPSGAAAAHRWLGVSELLSRSPVFGWQAQLPADRIVYRADSFVTLAAQARAGQGLAMLPDILGEGLTRAPGFDDQVATGIWVAAHPDLASTPRIAVCRRWFDAALSAEPAIAG